MHGRAAHAGLDPEKGVNAAVEAAHQVLAIAGIGAAMAGGAGSTGVPGGTGATGVAGDSAATGGGAGTSTVTPTLLSAGSTPNTVPARARIAVDVRVPTSAAQDHIDTLLRGLTPRTPGARLEIQDIGGRPPMEPGASAELFALASRIARELGQGPLRGIAVGGVSDGNCTAAVGCPTLDGLGAVGAGAHADDEYVEVASMIPRSRLLAERVTRTLR